MLHICMKNGELMAIQFHCILTDLAFSYDIFCSKSNLESRPVKVTRN
jgi:hypothetical protein